MPERGVLGAIGTSLVPWHPTHRQLVACAVATAPAAELGLEVGQVGMERLVPREEAGRERALVPALEARRGFDVPLVQIRQAPA